MATFVESATSKQTKAQSNRYLLDINDKPPQVVVVVIELPILLITGDLHTPWAGL